MRLFNTVLLLLGTALLVGLLWTIGPRELLHELGALGWGLIPFVLGEGTAEMIHTLGWRRCLSGPARSISWFSLYRIRMAGYAINYLTPTAALGGEVTKTALLTSKCPGSQAVSGVLIGKVCFSFAHVLFVALGSLVIVSTIRLAKPIWVSLLLSGAFVAAGIFTFILLQKHGKLGAVTRWLAARRIGGRTLEKAASQLTAVDEELLAFYRDRPGDMCQAVCWHLVGYSIGIFQTWLFLYLVHPPASFSVAAAIWFLGMWFDLLTFAVPMNLGSLEGSRILLLKLFGYGPALGMAYGLAIRLAQIIWSSVGLAIYATLTAGDGFSPFKSFKSYARTGGLAIRSPKTKNKESNRSIASWLLNSAKKQRICHPQPQKQETMGDHFPETE